MLSTLHVSVNCNSPSLVPTSLSTCILPICKNKFGSKKEDVDSAESGNGIQVFQNV